MAKLRFNIAMSLDGYVAGPGQSLENPLGEGGLGLHEWAFATRSFRAAHGMDGGETGLDDDHAASWNANIGATIMGRNMFGPVRGPWGDDAWAGWWGDDPPFHTPVFLTHHPREPLEMRGARPSTSSPTASSPRLSVPSRRPAVGTCPSAAAPMRHSSTCARV